ncbi:MAG: hypothetical protein ACHP7P_13925 [Terriglobales bacterium]
MSLAKQFTAFGFDGHELPRAKTAAGDRYQSPSSWAGTGPPGGGEAAGVGLAVTDGVGTVDEEVDCPHDEARTMIAMPSTAAIAAEPIPRRAVMRVLQRSQRTWLQGYESLGP